MRSPQLTLRAVLDAAGIAIASVGLEGHVLSASAEFARAVGRTPEDLVGVHLIGLCAPVDQAEVLAGLSHVVNATSRLERRVVRVTDASGSTATLRCTFARPDGVGDEIVVVLSTALTPAPASEPSGGPSGTVSDPLAERRGRRDRRSDRAGSNVGPAIEPGRRVGRMHVSGDVDALVAAALRRSGRTGTPFALIRVGLDGISTDGRGPGTADPTHEPTADHVTAALGDRMLRRLRPTDQVCRAGDDGFSVLAEDLCDVQDAAGVAYRLLSMAVEPLAMGGGAVRVALTVGVAVADTGTAADDIPAAAARALTEARVDGVGGFRIVDLRSGLAA